MAILIPSRSTRLTQPIGRAEVDPGYGITPIGLFLPASFTADAATGEVFTRGSEATLTTSRVGPALSQTAVNTGLHRTIPGFQAVSDYTAIWHGVPIGAPSGSTPAFVGIANSNTSQSSGPLSIEYLSATQLSVSFKSGASASSRAGNFTWANTYGKPTTLVASYSADEDFVRLRVCVDGVVTDVVASAVSSGAPPTVLGTERLIVGPDVVEIPTRHTNAHVALAGVFYGRLRGDAVQDVLRNPWRLFRPVERRIIVDLAASTGGGNSQAVAFTLDGISAAASQTLGHTQSASIALDGVTVAASQVAEHPQTLTATLDGITFAAAQSVGGANAQSLSITLDGVTFASAQTLEHSQSLAASLDGVMFSASQAVSNPVKDQAVSITLDGIGFAASQTGPKPADFVELLGGGPGLPKKRKQIEKGSYLERLLSPPLVDRLERIKPEAAEVIEEVAQEAVQQLEPMPVAVQALRKDLKAEGIAYREAYREVLAQLVSEMKRVQEEEEEELTAVLAAIF